MKFLSTKQNHGFTLVETLVGISIFTFSVLAVMSVLASGITDTSYAKQKMVAGYLAQEGIEYIRNLRDNDVLYSSVPPNNNWNTFKARFNPTTHFITTDNSPSIANFPGFTRTLQMTPISGTTDEVTIFSTVTWTQGSGQQSVTFAENLYNWVE
ncbi:MAG: prepilin-type N-terminal cleavage/methylation domain-containing protein [Patescibacteria group bacterium]|nr:prepilin-type N-terminal cleavage/methylation domain-containing protein [Patescibacteria group bacterium]